MFAKIFCLETITLQSTEAVTNGAYFKIDFFCRDGLSHWNNLYCDRCFLLNIGCFWKDIDFFGELLMLIGEEAEHIETVFSDSIRFIVIFIREVDGEEWVGVWDFIEVIETVVQALVKVVIVTPIVLLWVIVAQEVHYYSKISLTIQSIQTNK